MKDILKLRKQVWTVLMLIPFLCSCLGSDLLDATDPMSIDQSKAWTSDYLTRQGMNGVYAGLRLGMGGTSYDYYQFDQWVTTMPRNSEAASNILWGGTSSGDGLFLNVWKSMYEAIFRCNDAIVNIPVKSQSTESTKLQYEAEARFLRAFFYTKLNMLYRGVPLYDEVMTIEESNKARSSESDVWDFVLADLNFCLEGNKMPDKYEAGNSEYGRVSRGAAYALRGKVYIWLKEYEKAIVDFEETEKCGYKLFQGGYKQLFTEENEQCDEMIFSVQNIDRPDFGSHTQMYVGARSTKGGTGWNTFMVQPSTVDLHENADGTLFNWNDILPGYSAMEASEREVFFIRDSEGIEDILRANGFTGDMEKEVSAIKTAIEARLNNLKPETRALYLPDGNEARIRKAYENRDPRLEANIITPYAEFIGYHSSVGENIVTLRWPYRDEAPAGIRDLKTDTQGNLHYLHRKWVTEGDGNITDRQYGPTDFPILRLADIILLKAEALAELGRLPEAMKEVNRIRTRAEMPDITSANTSGKDELIRRIRNERKVELVNEGHSFFDELRWGTWKESKFTVYDAGCVHAWGGMVRPYATPTDKQLQYWPIPASEIEKNNLLIQNDGW